MPKSHDTPGEEPLHANDSEPPNANGVEEPEHTDDVEEPGSTGPHETIVFVVSGSPPALKLVFSTSENHIGRRLRSWPRLLKRGTISSNSS